MHLGSFPVGRVRASEVELVAKVGKAARIVNSRDLQVLLTNVNLLLIVNKFNASLS